jgi:acetolactate synthase-like protein
MFEFITVGGTLSVVGLLVALIAIFITYMLHRAGFLHLMFVKIDKESTRNGGDFVASTLKAHGVKYVFTLCGGHISTILIGCERLGIRVIGTRHEVNCVFAADAVARLSGVVGVACVTAGPGLTNTVTAIKNAQMAESPVLLLGGAAAGILQGRGALQDIDQVVLFKPLCKYVKTVRYVKDIVPTLRKAIAIAQSGTPGPVFVELPIDVLYPSKLVWSELLPKKVPKGFIPYMVSLYIKAYMTRVYAGLADSYDTSPLPVDTVVCNRSDVQRASSLIKKSKRPLFLLGSQATLPPIKAEDTRRNLEVIGIPCYLGGMSRGLLGRNGALHIRQKRRDALNQADLVVLIGSVCDFRLEYGRALNRKSVIIAVNRNRKQLYLNSDSSWSPTLALQGDPGLFIQELAEALKDYKCDQSWIDSLRKTDMDREENNKTKAEEIPEEHLNPLRVLQITEEVMSDNTIMVADGGDFVGTASYILRPRGPLMWLDPGAFGTLGVGGGFALGAKLCRPDSDVWIIYGDGSCGYSIPEFDTFVRYDLPIIALVGNDACWTQIAREQVPMLGSDAGCNLSYCDYDKVAEGFGGCGFLLKRGMTDEDIRDVLEKACEITRNSRKPTLINCLIGKTDFRKGSISV